MRLLILRTSVARVGLGVVALSAALAACAPASEATGAAVGAIRHGTPASDAGSTVALLGGPVVCTGVLVSPHLVLTAAHCLRLDSPDKVHLGANISEPGPTVDVAHREPHPGYDADTGDDDVAVVVLSTPAETEVTALPNQGYEPEVGASVRVVGFGTDDAGHAGVEREGWARISGVESRRFTVVASPALPCSGDSGGPAFLPVASGEVLVGLVSRGDPECQISADLIRVDAVLDEFIRPWFEATRSGAAAAGERCFFDENCADGPCVAPPDAPSHRYCAPPCSTGADCPADMRCGDELCLYSEPSPGAAGAACAEDADCESGRCGRSGAGASACTVACRPGELPCDEAFLCAADAAHPGEQACFVAQAHDSSGACTMAPTVRAASELDGATALLGVAATWTARRRSRRIGPIPHRRTP